MGDDSRCQVYSSSADAWVEAIGAECKIPGARPLPTEDEGPVTPQPGGQGAAAAVSPDTMGAPQPGPQQNPPPAQPPTATSNGSSAVQPDGGPQAHEQDVPPATQNGQDPDRSLAQQYLRPVNPLPQYGVLDMLLTQGLPPGAAQQQLLKIIRDEPEPGQPHPVFARNDRPNQISLLDPVEPFSGRYRVSVTDVSLPSRGMELSLTRVYSSGVVYYGPWGYNWDHSYNVYLRELQAGAVGVWTGALGEDVYRPEADGTLRPPLGVFRLLERQPGPSYWLTDRDGIRMEFETPAGWPLSDRIPLVRIRDRHDNVHALTYDAQGRLATVADALGRHIAFIYGSCGLLERVEDHTGRAWRYEHDREVEHLVAVRTPATSEYPDGLASTYEYADEEAHPAMRHNIVRVRNAADVVVCENTYGEDPYSTDFNRVVAQQLGDFESQFAAAELQVVPRDPPYVNAPTLRVEVVDPGYAYIYTFNFRGDLLDQRYRLLADGTLRLVARDFRYDEQGSLWERWEPDGSAMRYTRDVANAEPRARANLLSIERLAAAASVLPSQVIATYSWSEDGLRLARSQDAAGALTRFIYDVDISPTGRGDLIEVERPPATLPDKTVQPCVEHFKRDAHGQLVEHRTPAGALHTFTWDATGLMTEIVLDAGGPAPLKHTFEYDAWGHRVAVIDALGARWEETVNELGLVVSRRPPVVAGAVDEVRIYYDEQCQVRREEWPRGTYTDGVIGDRFIAHQYAYDALGHLTQATFGVNTARPAQWSFERDQEGRTLRSVDPLGRVTRQYFDERGLLLARTEAVGLAEEARWQGSYDRNGRRMAMLDPSGRETSFEWDGYGRLAAIELAGTPDASRTRVHHTHDTLDRVVRMHAEGLQSEGGVGVLSELETTYDERGRAVRRRAGALQSTITYDAEDREALREDQRGARHELVHDGVGRLLSLTDPAGVKLERTHDAAGRVLSTAMHEPQAKGPARTYSEAFTYDARGRLTAHTDELGRVWKSAWDARGLTSALTDPLGRVRQTEYDLQQLATAITQLDSSKTVLARHAYERDAVGRLLAYTDPGGRVTGWSYDARDRCTGIAWPDGSHDQFGYGAMQQPASHTRADGTVLTYSYAPDASLARLDTTAGAGLAPVAPLEMSSDGLRRLVSVRAGASLLQRDYDVLSRIVRERLDGVETQLAYDDATGIARFTYPDGRVDQIDHDLLGRVARRRLQTVGTAGATGALASGSELARWSYGGAPEPAGREAMGAVASRYTYDDGHRLVAIEHQASGPTRVAAVRYAHDRVDRRSLVWHDTPSGGARRHEYDALDHISSAARVAAKEPAAPATQADADALIAAAAGLVASSSETFALDGGDSLTASAHDGGSDAYSLDTLRAPSKLTRTGAGAGSWPWERSASGMRTLDERHRYEYDALGRLVAVRAGGGALLAALTYDPAGRLSTFTPSGGETVRHAHHGARRVQSSAGAATLQYTHGARPDELVLVSDGANRVLVGDVADSVLAALSEEGKVLERYAYRAFGRAAALAPNGTPRAAVTVAPGPIYATYASLGRDVGPPAALDLYHARARAYDPVSGRFLQPDPQTYADGPDRFAYVAGDPIDRVDPSGEIGLLAGILIAAAVGAVAGAAFNGVHQAIAISEGAQQGWEWGQFGWSVLGGAVAGPVLAFAPELAVPLAAIGVAEGIGEIEEGHTGVGVFDTAASLLPFAFKGARTATFGQGTVFGGMRGLGPAEGLGARLGHFQAIPGGGTTNPPGVRVQPVFVDRPGTPTQAWAKSVSTRLPVLSQWAEGTIRAQQEALGALAREGVPAARVIDPYRPGGALVIEDAGVQANVALRNDSTLRTSFDAYLAQARPVVSGPAGRTPLLGPLASRTVLLNDLAPRNIGYTPGRGFAAFDPSSTGNFAGLFSTLGFYGLGRTVPEAGQLVGLGNLFGEARASETALAGGTGK
jgi:YD repeat-containing protein